MVKRHLKTIWRTTLTTIVVGVLTISSIVLISTGAEAHGTMQSPPSRTYTCRFLENPEQPTSAACRAAIAAGGTQPVYDWNEVNLPDVAGRHQQVIPDGQLCSAGRDKYRGFDLARTDWPATRLPAGGTYTFQLFSSAPHQGRVDLYLTRPGYDPSQPLVWSSIDETPFASIETGHESTSWVATASLPAGRVGRHLIYAIWQRTDSPEAFYSCSDVILGDTAADTRPPEPVPAPKPTPATNDPEVQDPATHDHGAQSPPTLETSSTVIPAPVPGTADIQLPPLPFPTGSFVPQWRPGVFYASGVRVSYQGRVYECIQGHTSMSGWEPSAVLALWRIPYDPMADGWEWAPNVSYPLGASVTQGGNRYICIQAHTSLQGWEPSFAPALWRPA